MKTPSAAAHAAPPPSGFRLDGPQLDATMRSAIARQQSLIALAMLLGRTIFMLDSLRIVDILAREAMTQCPGLPEFVCGIVDSRGEAVPVMHLEAPAGEAAAPASHTHIVVLETSDGSEALGILIGSLEDCGAIERIVFGSSRQQ